MRRGRPADSILVDTGSQFAEAVLAVSEHPHLRKLMGAYLNQDFDLIADSIEGVIQYYRRCSSVAEVEGLMADIRGFLEAHPEDADAAFEAAYGFDFDPRLWGHSAKSFLETISGLLGQPSN